WLTGIVVVAAKVVFAIAQSVQPAAAASRPVSTTPVAETSPATPLSTQAHAALWAGSAAVTAVAVAVIAAQVISPSPLGRTAPLTVAGPGDHREIALAVDGNGRAFVAWSDLQAGSFVRTIRHQTGDGWSDPVNLSEGFVNTSGLMLRASPDGRVCAFFNGFPKGTSWGTTWGLYQRCWDGWSWSAPTQLTRIDAELTFLTTQWSPAFGPDGRVHTAWGTPPGGVGVGRQVLSAGGINGGPNLVTDSDRRLHLLWYNGSTGNLDHRWSGDGGRTWSQPVGVDRYAAYDIAADGRGGLHVVFASSGVARYHSWSVDTGWSAMTDAIGGTRNFITYLGIAGFDDGGAAVAWLPDQTLVISERQHDGAFGPGVPVAETSGTQVAVAKLAADGDHLHLVWLTGPGVITHMRLR
ncbi:MAG: hypothetical protein ACRDUA_21775, partial [Micromonosporaceae bacterium]